MTLVDVTNPRQPVVLAANVGDTDAQLQGCTTDATRHSIVRNVRTTLSLAVERNGVRDNAASGTALPARPGGRFGFVVRTGQDLRNAPGVRNVRSLLVFELHPHARHGENGDGPPPRVGWRPVGQAREVSRSAGRTAVAGC